jgi:predicted DNA-binding transcriptional regulator AlpA
VPELVSLNEIAAALGVAVDTVRRWHHRGDVIKARRFKLPTGGVRYARSDVDEWIAGMETSAA